MATTKKIYVGTVGLGIVLDMNATITDATNIKFRIKKPNTDKVIEVSAEVFETQKFRHVITSSDTLDEAGYYEIQPFFTLNGWTGAGKAVGFTVHEPLPGPN